MGIYPERSQTPPLATPAGGQRWTETVTEPGLVRVREVTAGPWTTTRTDCFCCTCDESEFGGLISDPACRNHGFAAKRPCDIHDMPGSEWDDFGPDYNGNPDKLAGTMPESVLTIRRRNHGSTDETPTEAEDLGQSAGEPS